MSYIFFKYPQFLDNCNFLTIISRHCRKWNERTRVRL